MRCLCERVGYVYSDCSLLSYNTESIRQLSKLSMVSDYPIFIAGKDGGSRLIWKVGTYQSIRRHNPNKHNLYDWREILKAVCLFDNSTNQTQSSIWLLDELTGDTDLHSFTYMKPVNVSTGNYIKNLASVTWKVLEQIYWYTELLHIFHRIERGSRSCFGRRLQ